VANGRGVNPAGNGYSRGPYREIPIRGVAAPTVRFALCKHDRCSFTRDSGTSVRVGRHTSCRFAEDWLERPNAAAWSPGHACFRPVRSGPRVDSSEALSRSWRTADRTDASTPLLRPLCRHEQIVRGHVLNLRGRPAIVAGHQLGGRRHCDVPAVAAKPLADVFAPLEALHLVVARDLLLWVNFSHGRPYPVHPLTPFGAHPGIRELGPKRLHGHAATSRYPHEWRRRRKNCRKTLSGKAYIADHSLHLQRTTGSASTTSAGSCAAECQFHTPSPAPARHRSQQLIRISSLQVSLWLSYPFGSHRVYSSRSGGW
jgi:hypothetical protein